MSHGEFDELASFMGEAEELVAGLYETLAGMEAGTTPRQADVNTLFRATHTLKGLAGMLDFHQMQAVAHGLEDLLGAVRLGRLPWSAHVGEVVAQGVDLFREMIQSISATGADGALPSAYLEAVARASKDSGDDGQSARVDLAPEVRSALTEYEEARLLTCLRGGQTIYEILFLIKLSEFGTVGKEIAEVLEATGEIITKLPAPGSPGGADQRFLYIAASADPGFEGSLPEVFGARYLSSRPLAAQITGGGPAASGPSDGEATGPHAADAADETPEAAAEASPGRGVASASVRIELQTLEAHTALVGGLLVEKARLEDIARRYREMHGDEAPYPELLRTIRDVEKKVTELQRSLMTVRLVPIGQIWSRLRRIVQGYSRASGKRIALALDGGETKLDKVLVEKLADPLVHIIRNAIDHGIEPPSEREDLGKPPQGHVRLMAAPRGSQIVVSVKDDGRGIDWDRVREKAGERGLLKDPAAATPRELTDVLFQPGFSTAPVVTDLSGRGVGLDVVRKNLADINAFIDIQSVRHEGTEITLTLPITLAIFQSLIVEVSGRVFAIPLSSVLENLRLEAQAVQSLEGRPVIRHRGAEIQARDLGQALRLPDLAPTAGPYRYFVVVGSAEKRLALRVDSIRGQREIVTKSLGRVLSSVPGIAGGALVGESRMALVLDVSAIIAEEGV